MAFGGARGFPVHLGNGVGLPFGPNPQAFYVPFRQPARYVITGITRDSTGAAIGSVTCYLLEQPLQTVRGLTISDANGNYMLDGQIDTTYKVDFYKSGAPDLAGSTVNTLVAVPA